MLSVLLLGSVVSGSALASCPAIEGKYDYRYTVEKNSDAVFASVLEVAGKMTVNQAECRSYTFTNPRSGIAQEIFLTDIDQMGYLSHAMIKKSSSDTIRFKIVEHGIMSIFDFPNLKAEVTKGLIRKNRNGFTLRGRERSRVLGVFGDRHSKFKCDFTAER